MRFSGESGLLFRFSQLFIEVFDGELKCAMLLIKFFDGEIKPMDLPFSAQQFRFETSDARRDFDSRQSEAD